MNTQTDSWSITTSDVFERIRQALADDSPLAVATIIDVSGTAYRRPGAKMVIEPNGASHGGITAGCLQDSIRVVANEVLESGTAIVVTYDLTNNDGWGLGLGCNGIIDVLVEPVDDSWQKVVDTLAIRQACSLVTAIESSDPSIPVGSRAVIGEQNAGTDRRCLCDRFSLPDSIVADVETQARACAAEGNVGCVSVSTGAGELVLVIDGVEPPQQLVVFGTQPDVRPITRFAAQVGIRVTVATARGGRATEEMFPAAEDVLALHPTDLSDMEIDRRSSILIMSHNFIDDRLALEAALETEASYIGLMGPRKRFDELQSTLKDEGVNLSKNDRERIATPVGLDLGSDTPVEIALSIVSEVVAVGNGRDGGQLVDQVSPVHDRQPISSQ